MQAVQEVTEWNWEHQPNHIYLLEGDKMLAYIPKGQTKPIYLKQPMQLNMRYRKFVPLKKNPFKIKIDESHLIKVKGSRGEIYTVDTAAKSCSCPGFRFRGNCKHLLQSNQ